MARTDNMDFWRRTAGIYGRSVRRSSAETYDEVCTRIRSKLSRDMSVLELACGTGQLTFPLCGSVAQWEATDLSEAMIERAKKVPHSERVRFTVQNAESLPYEHSTFDAVVISNALHIMPRPDLALREIRRVLKPGGLLFAPTYVHGGVRKSVRITLMTLGGFRVFHRWSAGDLAKYIQSYGFAVDRQILLSDKVVPLCYIEAHSEK